MFIIQIKLLIYLLTLSNRLKENNNKIDLCDFVFSAYICSPHHLKHCKDIKIIKDYKI